MAKEENYRDFKTVESIRNDIIPEEFPEGPYGAATNEDALGKETPYTAHQHAAPQYTYEDREFHAGLNRQDPSAHPTHSEASDERQALRRPT